MTSFSAVDQIQKYFSDCFRKQTQRHRVNNYLKNAAQSLRMKCWHCMVQSHLAVPYWSPVDVQGRVS